MFHTAAHGPADEHLESFQDLFWQAGINVKNPEMFAYFFFQEHLGNLTFNEVSNKKFKLEKVFKVKICRMTFVGSEM